jgi:hypothetical protein
MKERMLETTMRREAIERERRHIQDASDDTRALQCSSLWIEMREGGTESSNLTIPDFHSRRWPWLVGNYRGGVRFPILLSRVTELDSGFSAICLISVGPFVFVWIITKERCRSRDGTLIGIRIGGVFPQSLLLRERASFAAFSLILGYWSFALWFYFPCSGFS